jgi:hypothetical protein
VGSKSSAWASINSEKIPKKSTIINCFKIILLLMLLPSDVPHDAPSDQ